MTRYYIIAISVLLPISALLLLFLVQNIGKNAYHSLHWAIHDADDIQVVKEIIDSKKGIVNRKAKSDFVSRNIWELSSSFPYFFRVQKRAWYKGTPLHVACMPRGRCLENVKLMSEIVDLLIASGGDVNIRNSLGLSPLDFAAQEGNNKIIESLVNAGANPYKEVIARPADSPAFYSCPIISIIDNDCRALRVILRLNADIDKINLIHNWGEGDFTILDVAITRKNENIIKLLRDAGAKTAKELKAKNSEKLKNLQ